MSRPDMECPLMPAFPLAAAMRRLAERENPGLLECDGIYSGMVARADVSDRTFRAWMCKERKTTQFDVADKVMQNLGLLWWDVYPPEQYPEVAAIFEPDMEAA